MKLLTVGFVFNKNLNQVLLLHKQKPDWQVGKLNGCGGKVEDGEATITCVARECLEETCLNIPVAEWVLCATVEEAHEDGSGIKRVDFFAATYTGDTSDAKRGDYEDIEWFNCDSPLPENAIQNLHFLVPLARETLRGHQATVLVKY